jgi:4-amino-4-deoxy-L-arabinose transferase-like glycosyltransferase
MEKRVVFPLTLMIALLIALEIWSVSFNSGAWWDEAVYLGLGRGIMEGRYSMGESGPIESFRPPLYPFAISAVSWSIEYSRMISVIFSAISILAVYLFVKENFGKKAALVASLLLATNAVFLFFSSKVLSESLFIFLSSLALLFFSRWKKTGKYRFILFSGILSGMCFITRYFATILIVSVMFYLAFLVAKAGKKKRRILASACIYLLSFSAVLIPWFGIGAAYYGSPLGSYFYNIEVYSYSDPLSMADLSWANPFPYFLEFFQLSSLLIAIGLAIFSFRRKWNESGLFLVIIAAFSFAFFIALPHKELRYLLSFSPAFMAIAGYGAACLFEMKRPIRLGAVIIILLAASSGIFYGINMSWNDRYAASGLIQACGYLKEITAENETIMSSSYPYVYYFSGRRAITISAGGEEMLKTVREGGIRYILFYRFEPGNPGYAEKYLAESTDFEKTKLFYQWGDSEAVIIYKYKG